MRDGMHPRARSGNLARGHVERLVLVIASGIMIAGCRSASTPADSQAPPPPASASSTSASAATPAPAPPAPSSPVPEFGTLPPPPPPPDPSPPSGSVATSEGWTTPSQSTTSTPAAPSTPSTSSTQAPPSTSAAQTPGYRVQIFASSDRNRAESAAAEARQRFAEPVYIEFEAPLYKVRVGDCATRHEADTLKERAGAQGYDGAWVAETQVRSH